MTKTVLLGLSAVLLAAQPRPIVLKVQTLLDGKGNLQDVSPAARVVFVMKGGAVLENLAHGASHRR